MGQVRSVAIVALLLSFSCGGDDEAPISESPCKAFAKASVAPVLRTTLLASEKHDAPRHVTFAGGQPFVVDAASPYDDAIATAGAVFATRRKAGGFDVLRIAGEPKVETILATIAGAVPADAALPIVFGADGRLLVGAPSSMLALGAAAPGAPEELASGFTAPRALSVDTVTNEVWLIDRTPEADIVHRVRTNVSRKDAPGAPLPARIDAAAAVVRDGRSARLEGRLVYAAKGTLVVVDAYGPSGPAAAVAYPFTGGPVVGVDAKGSAVVATNDALSVLEDAAPPPAPLTLRETGCLDPAVAGALLYDVASPLWSDGAEKQRAVVLPPGGQARVLADGDLKLPVGTVAIKTFGRGGKRVETRLFVQHAIDDWVGYSYAWNAAGTDADLVKGNAVRDGWYFPSSADCNACHTPAAGFTLGLEARQLDDASKAKLAPSAMTPRLSKDDARAYLHSNCSMCHREGSATGLAELDLRWGTPLDRTGLCGEPKVGPLGIDPAEARIVAPGAPERSVLVKRMRTLGEARMPKLASHVVDDAGVALVESWIRGLSSCP